MGVEDAPHTVGVSGAGKGVEDCPQNGNTSPEGDGMEVMLAGVVVPPASSGVNGTSAIAGAGGIGVKFCS